MSITDELKHYISDRTGQGISLVCEKRIANIADRIDEAHERAMEEQFKSLTVDMEPMTDENMAKGGWVRLPLDADGVPIHVGDVLTDGEYRFKVYELATYSCGSWSIYNRSGKAWAACDVEHCPATTVEDVLDEFASAYDRIGGEDEEHQKYLDLIAKYAKRLTLTDREGI